MAKSQSHLFLLQEEKTGRDIDYSFHLTTPVIDDINGA